MINYIKDIWNCRYFWLSLVRMDLRTRYRRSVLGIGWSLLNPIAMTIILTTVFHEFFHLPIKEYALYLITGLATWQYVLNVSLHGCQCSGHLSFADRARGDRTFRHGSDGRRVHGSLFQ
jgi:lipopolysaccharide transport system permease protein